MITEYMVRHFGGRLERRSAKLNGYYTDDDKNIIVLYYLDGEVISERLLEATYTKENEIYNTTSFTEEVMVQTILDVCAAGSNKYFRDIVKPNGIVYINDFTTNDGIFRNEDYAIVSYNDELEALNCTSVAMHNVRSHMRWYEFIGYKITRCSED